MSHICLLSCIALLFLGCIAGHSREKSELWVLDDVNKIGGHRTALEGKPQVIETQQGKALAFNGQNDAVILDTNPLAGAGTFTVEVVFRPDPQGSKEQRFLHMQASEDWRVLLETRVNDRNEWFLDTFIKCGPSERTLQSRATWHPLGRWYHVALVYDGREMRHFVNRIQEMAGSVDYSPMRGGQTSIGCRLNRVYWFRGAIRLIRVTHSALKPDEFLPFDEK